MLIEVEVSLERSLFLLLVGLFPAPKAFGVHAAGAAAAI